MLHSRRRTLRRRILAGTVVLVLVAAAGGSWLYVRGWPATGLTPANAKASGGSAAVDAAKVSDPPLIVTGADDASAWAARPKPAAAEPLPSRVADEVLKPTGPLGLISNTPDGQGKKEPAPPTTAPAAAEAQRSDNPAIEAARRKYSDGKLVDARHDLNALLQQSLTGADQAEVRRLLTTLADETIFSRRRLADDPLVDQYTVQGGDVLVRIGQEYKVPSDILMRINGIKDERLLRADQKIKVLRGPFHARIQRSDFRLDVYLQDLYVKSFRVALGADQGTPLGVWRVKERLSNPTYYPPASSDKKRIIPPSDPENPLGGYWIALEGVDGEAVGHTGYGIHGTNDPDSIGKAVSLGCVRLHNEDVAILYSLLLPNQSTVTILP